MSCMSQNFRLFHVSNLSVRNFRIFLLMYTGSPPPFRLLCLPATGRSRVGPPPRASATNVIRRRPAWRRRRAAPARASWPRAGAAEGPRPVPPRSIPRPDGGCAPTVDRRPQPPWAATPGADSDGVQLRVMLTWVLTSHGTLTWSEVTVVTRWPVSTGGGPWPAGGDCSVSCNCGPWRGEMATVPTASQGAGLLLLQSVDIVWPWHSTGMVGPLSACLHGELTEKSAVKWTIESPVRAPSRSAEVSWGQLRSAEVNRHVWARRESRSSRGRRPV